MKLRNLMRLLVLLILVVPATACSTAAHRGSGDVATPQVPATVIMDGALRREYFAPSLSAFTRSGLVTQVVRGQIVATDVRVQEPGTEVFTFVTIEVDGGRLRGSQVVTRSHGGVVTLGQVAADFEGRMEPAEIEKHADSLVDYQVDGQPHPKVGEHVLALLGGQSTDPGGYFTAAILIQDSDGRFSWPGVRANPDWQSEVGLKEANALLSADLGTLE
jgi:hypothetical protein